MIVVKYVGIIWALFGVATIVVLPWSTWNNPPSDQTLDENQLVLTGALVLSVLIYVIPGLVLYALGNKKKA